MREGFCDSCLPSFRCTAYHLLLLLKRKKSPAHLSCLLVSRRVCVIPCVVCCFVGRRLSPLRARQSSSSRRTSHDVALFRFVLVFLSTRTCDCSECVTVHTYFCLDFRVCAVMHAVIVTLCSFLLVSLSTATSDCTNHVTKHKCFCYEFCVCVATHSVIVTFCCFFLVSLSTKIHDCTNCVTARRYFCYDCCVRVVTHSVKVTSCVFFC